MPRHQTSDGPSFDAHHFFCINTFTKFVVFVVTAEIAVEQEVRMGPWYGGTSVFVFVNGHKGDPIIA